ncbi:MAG: CaiB/BaiF CoA transferase family protein [Promethearchaeota archaeon]|jgi:crotonobetainyl-CoA:carnitine CoA-transferase CaiB-like acyl-CoA transferase
MISKLPLEGIITIDFSTLIAAPIVGTLMADFGAEVIKVELPKIGDPQRGIQFGGKGRSHNWLVGSRNKKAITLDLHSKKGQELARKLCEKADVVLFNFRPGVLDKWNLSPDILHQINPNLIICLISGYGQTGPYKHKGGFDRTVSAFAGLTYTSGYAEHPPVRSGHPLIDYLTGYLGAFAVMMALYNRDVNQSGGEVIDLSLAEAAFKATGGSLTTYSLNGSIYERCGNRIRFFVPAENFETSNGEFVAINAGTEKLWKQLVKAMNREDLLTSKKYGKYLARFRNQDELYKLIGEWVKNKTTQEVMHILEREGVPCDKVNNIADLAADPHMLERDAILKLNDVDYGDLLIPGIVPKLKNFPGKVKFLGAGLGEYNREIFEHFLGLRPEEIKDLEENGII